MNDDDEDLDKREAKLEAALAEDAAVTHPQQNELVKYSAQAWDRFSTGAFLASIVASPFAFTTNWVTWQEQTKGTYLALCVVLFVVALSLHVVGKRILEKGLK